MSEIKMNAIDMQAVVLMGGLGTRLGLGDIPKTMADVQGSPFFSYELKLLKRYGFHRFLFLIGHGGNMVREYFGNGEKWDVSIDYVEDGGKLLGTGGAIKHAFDKLDDSFMLIYGDSFMDIDYRRMYYHYLTIDKSKALMCIYFNGDKYDKSNVIFKDGELELYDKKNLVPEMDYIDYGVSILNKKMFDDNVYGDVFDLSDLLCDSSKSGRLIGHEVRKRFYEIGSQKSLEEFREYVKWRFIDSHKAIFFDRDGVINEIVFNDDIEQFDSPLCIRDFKYCEGVKETLAKLQGLGYLLFVVSNQPAAAKGKVSIEKIYEINDWMEEDLLNEGIHIENVNICPHHPKGNGQSKYSFLIKDCNCRKPKSGLIDEIVSVYHIDRNKSYMVGDSITDVIAGREAGLKSVLIGELKCDACHKLGEIKPDCIIEKITMLEGEIYE